MIEDAEKYNINLSLETDLEPLKFIHLINEFKSEKIKIKKGYTFLKKELGEEGVVQRAAKDIINSIF